ncbi:MAG: hypothetical protein WD448_13495 [Woeseia sp.]
MSNDEGLRPLEDALQRLRKTFADRVANYSLENSLFRIGEVPSPGEQVFRRGGTPSKTQLQVELKRVDAALSRIQAGTFGVCCRCAIEIDLKWLTEDPATPFCRPCFDELTTQRQKLRR